MPDWNSSDNQNHLPPLWFSEVGVGRVLGNRYRLVALIGSGSSARVYLAEDISLGRRVAVKCLRAGLTGDYRFLRRFRAEAKAAAQLGHPHILAIHDWGEDASAAYLVSEVLLGGTLRDMVDGHPPLSPSQGLLVALQVAQGLSYAHELGWVHRDIKPANLLFGKDGRLRIADFGIARALAESTWTEPEGMLVGTARYAAPEQASGSTIDGKADVYALAVTVAEAVTGVVPLLADNALSTMLLRQDRDVEGLDNLGDLGQALMAAGRAVPAARPDATELIDMLLTAARRLPRPGGLPLVEFGTEALPEQTSIIDLRASRKELEQLGSVSGPDSLSRGGGTPGIGLPGAVPLVGGLPGAVPVDTGVPLGVRESGTGPTVHVPVNAVLGARPRPLPSLLITQALVSAAPPRHQASTVADMPSRSGPFGPAEFGRAGPRWGFPAQPIPHGQGGGRIGTDPMDAGTAGPTIVGPDTGPASPPSPSLARRRGRRRRRWARQSRSEG